MEFVHLILIPIGNDQTLSTYFSAVCPAVMLMLLYDVNIPSAHGLNIPSARGLQ